MSLANKHADFNIRKELKQLGLSSDFYLAEDRVDPSVDCVLLRFPTVSINFNSDRAKAKETEIIGMLKAQKDMDTVYTNDEMNFLGNDRYGDATYYLKKGYTNASKTLIKYKPFGYHGTENEKDATITFWGSGVEKNDMTKAELIDIVPTCLDYLGITSD